MNLQPSLSISFNDRRALFADELTFGGHGQRYLSGGGTYFPNDSCVFYSIQFLKNTTVTSAGFRNTNSTNQVIYKNDSINNVAFPQNYTWNAPLTSISLSAGGYAIAYQYRLFLPEDLDCGYF
jgi:hypothetical protein